MRKYSSYQKLFRATLAATVTTGALVAAVPNFTMAAESKSTSFSDVKQGHHFYEGVMELTARGVINGYTDGTYRPGEYITRAQAAKIIALALDLDTKNVKDPGFKDVKKGHPFYSHIAALVEAGVISGYKDDTFKPDGNLTRAQMSKMLVLGFNIEEEKLSNLPFKDVNGKQWFANYIQTLYSNEITSGTTATTFSPDAIVTRGQVAAFVHKSGLKQSKGIAVIGFSNGKLELADGTYNVHASLKDVFNEANLPALKGALVKVKVENGTVVGVSSIELKANGAVSNGVALDGNGATLSGNVFVNGDYVSLKNLTVKGNVEIGKQVTNSFNTDKVTVTGKTIISDKATATAAVYSVAAEAKSPTFTFNNSTIGTIEVIKKGATVEAKGTTKVEEMVLSSNVTVKADAGITIPKVSVKTGATQVTLDANVGSLNINSTGNLTLAGTGNIKDVKVDSKKDVNFETTGKIDKLTVTSKDSKVSLGADTRVGDITLPTGSSVQDIIQDYDKAKANIEKVGGETNPDAKPAAPVVGGGGGGGAAGGGSGTGTPPADKTAKELLNDKLQVALKKIKDEKDSKVAIGQSGNDFNVTFAPETTFNHFYDASKDLFEAFEEDTTVSRVTWSYKTSDGVELEFTVPDVDNSLGFVGSLNMVMGKLGIKETDSLSILNNRSVSFTVTGIVDKKDFTLTYNFNFR